VFKNPRPSKLDDYAKYFKDKSREIKHLKTENPEFVEGSSKDIELVDKTKNLTSPSLEALNKTAEES